MKKIVVLLILFLIPITIFADTYSYNITKYHVKISFNKNNVIDVEEQITANFNEYAYKHGIMRYIPIINYVKREDGTSYTNRARITNLYVNNKKETTYENGFYSIKIGDANKYVSGDVKYIIKYKYSIGDNRNNKYDEIYFNIIGDKWDTTISNISFEINMPKKFDKSKLGFTWGPYGSSYTNNISYDVKNNKINGVFIGDLGAYNGLTVRMELPDDYFINEKASYGIDMYLIIILEICLLILTVVLWLKHGKDDLVIEPVSFYPPEGLNSLDLARVYKGYAINKDVVSLLVYLANKKYLKIVEIEAKSFFGKKKTFKIVKEKEYDGNNPDEITFLNGLFSSKTEVEESDLKEKFYTTISTILTRQNSSKNKEKIYEKKSLQYKVLVIVFIVSTIILTFIKPLIFFFGNLSVLISYMSYEKIYIINYLVGAISLIGMIIFAAIMKKRTKYGNEMLGQIRGFKNFLELAEKSKLEKLVEENPTYFYDILPYTYVLGISAIWMKKFESIAMVPPTWYDSNSAFNIIYFSNFMDTTMTTATTTMTSRPAPSGGGFSGGGFSGGGFSGGGSGGGGGGSW